MRRVADIEEDLKLCAYRAQAPEPTAADIFGPQATSVSFSSRKVEIDCRRGPEAPTWQVSPEFALLPLQFEEVTIDYSGPLSDLTVVLLSYDPDTRSGYVVVPGFSNDEYYRDTVIERLEGEKKTRIAEGYDKCHGRMAFKVVRTPSRISLTLEGGRPLAASDSRLKRGVLGLRDASRGRVLVSGVVEKIQFQALVAAHYERRFREWAEKAWKREEHLPAWATAAPAVSGTEVVLAPLPADAPDPVPEGLVRALEHWSRGEVREFLKALPPPDDLRSVTRHYLQGLAALGGGRLADADRLFTLALEGDATFTPAQVYRGFVRYRLRDLAGARGDLEKALESGASIPDVWIGLALLGIADGDLPRADKVLADARARGMTNQVLDRLATQVLRSRRGPSWTKRFEVKGAAALVATDHSLDVAIKVSRVVEGTLSLGTAVFPDTVRASAPMRVHVFSGRDGFLAYTRDLGHVLPNAAGVYFPRVRELVLWMPDLSREDLWNTVRHEAFHAFLHASLEDAPIWFNEGWAECFGYGKPAAGGIALAEPERETLREVPTISSALLEELLLMDSEAFHRNSGRNYALSRSLVHFLYDFRKPSYRATLHEYFKSLRLGASQKEAFEKHWKPILQDVEARFSGWMAERKPL